MTTCRIEFVDAKTSWHKTLFDINFIPNVGDEINGEIEGIVKSKKIYLFDNKFTTTLVIESSKEFNLSKKGWIKDPKEQEIQELNHWLARLNDLIEMIKGWAEEADCSTKIIDKKLKENNMEYIAPCLMIQKNTSRFLLDVISGELGYDKAGIAEFYLMPAYDDVTSIILEDDVWKSRVPSGYEEEYKPFTRELFLEILAKVEELSVDS